MPSTNANSPTKKDFRKIFAAFAVGTIIEWYNFFIYGSLATVIAGQFYPPSNPTAALLYTLATFAAGFFVRPFGARIFGLGRSRHKYSWLLPLFIMGGSTFAIGLIPGYSKIGLAAPMLVLLLRLLQGLALGGGFLHDSSRLSGLGPIHRSGNGAGDRSSIDPGHGRALNTSWIPATTTMGLLLSLGVILLVRHGLDSDPTRSIGKFNDWGWRIPFLISPVLTAVSVYIRSKMQEWPAFPPLPAGAVDKANGKVVLLALFGATMGQGVIFYTGQLYVQPFLETVCQIDFDQAKTMLLLAGLTASPLFFLFGSWRDRLGHKWIMTAGLLMAIVTFPFLFRALQTIPGTAGRTELVAEKEIISTVSFIENSKDLVHISTTINHYEGGLIVTQMEKDTLHAGSSMPVTKRVVTVSRKVSSGDFWKMTGVLFLMAFYATIIGGAVAAFLDGPSLRHNPLPYEIGNGIIGGMTPFIATLLTAIYPGHALAGLWYPMGVAAICLIAGVIGLPGRGSDAEKA